MKSNHPTIAYYGLVLAVTLVMLIVAVPAAAQMDVTIEKATNGMDADTPPGAVLMVGDPVAWTYEVINTGGRELTDIVVTDDQGETVNCPGTTLDAGESMTCTANGTVQAGQYANIGTVTAETDGVQVQDSDPSHYFGVAEVLITLEKATEGFDADTPPGPALPVDSTVGWAYEVTNTGTETLSNIEVTDDQGVTVSCPAATLGPGESMTCTASGTVAPGQYMNLGSVTAELPDSSSVFASDPSHYFGQSLRIEKATNGEDADFPPGPTIFPGDPVAWAYVVTNPGPETITDLAVNDDQEGAITCPVTTLAAGESITCAANGVAEAGQYANIGTATALLPLGGQVAASNPSHYLGAGFGIKKRTNGVDADEPPGPALPIGSVVDWTYEVINALPEDLSDIQVTDSQGETVTCPSATLTAGSSMVCTASGTVVAGQYMNIGSVSAELPDSTIVTADDASHYFGQALLLEKATNGFDADTPPGPTLEPGTTVTWTYEVTNPGPATITDLAVNDDQEGAITCPLTTLAANESTTCTADGVVQQGQYANIGTATAQLPEGGQIMASDPSHYFGGGLDIQKSTNGDDADEPPGPVLPVGSTVDWTYEITNALPEDLTNIEVTDSEGETVTCPSTTLMAGSSMVCTASGTVVAGQYMNIGSVSAELPDSTIVTADDASHYFGQALLLEKATNGFDADTPPGPILEPGTTVTWTYEVSNPGPETINDLTVNDDQEGTITCPLTTLAANESTTCTADGVVQQGQYANIGTATAQLPEGGQIMASDPSHYFGGGLDIQKRTNGDDADDPPGPVLPVGSTVEWTYELTNALPEDLTNIEVTDSEGETVTCPSATLTAGSSMVCTASGTVVAGQYMNIGSVSAELPDSTIVTADDASHYFGQALLLEKATNGFDADTPPGPILEPGTTVTWTYEVSNPGPETINDLTVNDDQEGTITCPLTTLAANESTTCTADGVVQQGQYANIGTATAQLPEGGQIMASDPSHYFGQEIPTIPALGIWGLLLTFLLLLAIAWHRMRSTA